MALNALKTLLFGRLMRKPEPAFLNPDIGISFLRNSLESGILNIYNMRRRSAGTVTVVLENDEHRKYSYTIDILMPVSHKAVELKDFTDQAGNPFGGYPDKATANSLFGEEKYIFDGNIFRKIK